MSPHEFKTFLLCWCSYDLKSDATALEYVHAPFKASAPLVKLFSSRSLSLAWNALEPLVFFVSELTFFFASCWVTAD